MSDHAVDILTWLIPVAAVAAGIGLWFIERQGKI